MSESDDAERAGQILKWFTVVLLLFAVAMVVLGEFLVAGVTFLGLTFVIYLRETWE